MDIYETPTPISHCCSKLQLTFEGSSVNHVGLIGGIYDFEGSINGRQYWSDGNFGIWFSGYHGNWVLSAIGLLGENVGLLIGSSTENCPMDVPDNAWSYLNQTTLSLVEAVVGEIKWECLGS